MSGFEQKEIIGRDKTRQLYPHYELVESVDKYAAWDMSGCTSTSTGDVKNYFIEVKDRGVKSTTYDTIFIELNKYEKLIELADQYSAAAFYISYYRDDVAYVHNLTKLDKAKINLVVKKAPKTTFGNTQWIDKTFIELPIAGGIKKEL